MMTRAAALQLCEENRIKIVGELVCDPINGWIDKSMEYEPGFSVICLLNITDDLCRVCCGHETVPPCEVDMETPGLRGMLNQGEGNGKLVDVIHSDCSGDGYD